MSVKQYIYDGIKLFFGLIFIHVIPSLVLSYLIPKAFFHGNPYFPYSYAIGIALSSGQIIVLFATYYLLFILIKKWSFWIFLVGFLIYISINVIEYQNFYIHRDWSLLAYFLVSITFFFMHYYWHVLRKNKNYE